MFRSSDYGGLCWDIGQLPKGPSTQRIKKQSLDSQAPCVHVLVCVQVYYTGTRVYIDIYTQRIYTYIYIDVHVYDCMRIYIYIMHIPILKPSTAAPTSGMPACLGACLEDRIVLALVKSGMSPPGLHLGQGLSWEKQNPTWNPNPKGPKYLKTGYFGFLC